MNVSQSVILCRPELDIYYRVGKLQNTTQVQKSDAIKWLCLHSAEQGNESTTRKEVCSTYFEKEKITCDFGNMSKQLKVLEFQPMLSSGLCKSFYAAMVEETTTVEDNFGNSFLQARLGNHFTNLLCYFLEKQIPEQ